MTKHTKVQHYNFTTEFLNNFTDICDRQLTSIGIPGFLVRYSKLTGRKVFYLNYYNKFTKKSRNLKIGTFPEMSIKRATQLATKYRAQMIEGIDPYRELRNQNRALIETENSKIDKLFEKYNNEYSMVYKKPSSIKSEQILIRKHLLPFFKDMNIKQINFKTMSEMHSQFHTEKTKFVANRCLAFMSAFLNWCEKYEYRNLNSNPCRLIRKFKEEKRDRVLSESEYCQILDLLDDIRSCYAYSDSSIDALKLIIFTGCRLSEATKLTWEEVDFDNHLIRLKDSKTGGRSIPLGDMALKVLKQRFDVSNYKYVFPSPKSPNRPIVDIRKLWEYVIRTIGLKNVRVHDFRHSFATIGSLTGENIAIVGSVLGHKQLSTTQRYTHINNIAGIQVANRICERINSFSHKEIRND